MPERIVGDLPVVTYDIFETHAEAQQAILETRRMTRSEQTMKQPPNVKRTAE